MKIRTWMTALASLAWAAAAAAADPPRHPRAQIFGAEQEIAGATLFGGAIEAEVEVADVDFVTPAFLNGIPQDGLADLHFEVQLRYTAARVLGSRTAGEFVPYQKVHVRIENTTTTSEDRVLELDLGVHAGHGEGWHYASNVLLPPGDDDVDPFNDTYRVSVTIEPAITVPLHVDAQPASRLFRTDAPMVVFDDDVVFGGITTLPVGDVAAQLARVQAFADIKVALDGSDFEAAAALFQDELAEPAAGRMDPAEYAAERGLTAEELADLVPNIEAALAQDPVGPDCNVVGEPVSAECKEWIKKGIERFFYLSILHEIDEAGLDLAAGATDAVEGAAHKWDEAWAYYQALRETAGKRQTNCDAARFGSGIDCGMDERIGDALLGGSNALLAHGGVGFDAARAEVEGKLLQIFYLGVVHEIIAMREKMLAADEPGFNKARVEARAFYRVLAYLLPSADVAVFDAALEDRALDFEQDEARSLVARLNAALGEALAAAELADPEVTP